MPELVEFLCDVLDDHGIQSTHYFGHHTGNKLGAALGARHSDRIERLVFSGQPHSIIPDKAARDDIIRKHVDDSIRTFPPSADGAHHLKSWATLQRRVADVWWDPAVLAAAECSESQIDVLADRVIATIQSRNSLKAAYEANFGYDWSANLQQIAAETLILELANDAEIEAFGAQAEAVRALVPDGECKTIDNGDDTVFWDSPEQITRPVRDFLRGAER